MSMDMDREEGGGVVAVMRNRAEIDTRAPFQSVKEAVMLFGERVLAGEVYANKLKQMKEAAAENGSNNSASSKIGTVTAELEETKQSLDKAKEEGMLMANCLDSLKQELEHTKRELQLLKATKETEKQTVPEEDYEMEEDLKFMEQKHSNTTPSTPTIIVHDKQQLGTEFEKKRFVQFASPPSLARVMSPLGDYTSTTTTTTTAIEEQMLQRHPSLKNKKKKKPLIPLIGGIFSKLKRNQGVASPKVRAP